MEDKKEKSIEEIFTEARTYVETRVEYTRLFAIKKGSKVFADMVTTAIVAVCFILAFILGTVTLALYLSTVFHSYTAGFGAVAVLYIIMALTVYLTKDNFIEKAIANAIIKRHFRKFEEDEEDEQKV